MDTSTKSAAPAQIGLASWLGGGSVFIVLIAVAAMAIACALLLNHQVKQEALVRADLAATSARELLRRLGEDALSDARVLAERPTLQRIIDRTTPDALQPLLRRFCESSNSDVCAVMRGATMVASSGPAVDWTEITTAVQEQGERFQLAPAQGGAPIWGGAVVLPGTDLRVFTLRLATPKLLTSFGQQVGANLQLVNFRTYTAPADDPLTALHTQALASGRAASAQLSQQHEYAASIVVAAPTGEVIGLLDARLSDAEFTAAVKRFNRVLIILASIVAIIAGLVGVWYGRWLAGPVIALRDAALRIGRGDFSAAIPSVAPMEVGALARSMDEMRRNLVDLTGTLRRSEAEAQAVLSGVIEGVYAVDSERRIRYANVQVARLLGRPQDEIIGRFCGDVLQPQPVNGERPCERQCPIVAARNAPQGVARELLCLANGTTRSTIVLSAPPVHGVQVQVLRDETDLEAARRARDSVLGNISHEFRTPLAAQLAAVELLRDGLDKLPPEGQRELLGNIERGVLRLMRLIDNLLESVRIESGQLAIRQQSVDLRAVVDEATQLIAPLLNQRRLQVVIELPPDAAIVSGDAQRLQQVFINLLANAAKFAPEGSILGVGGITTAGRVEVWVEDGGPGVPADSTAAVFDRFGRGAGREPDAPGLGLGLWIVKSIVERHAGSVRVERTAAQRTRFILNLPLETPA